MLALLNGGITKQFSPLNNRYFAAQRLIARIAGSCGESAIDLIRFGFCPLLPKI
jgi:hypothetical protein